MLASRTFDAVVLSSASPEALAAAEAEVLQILSFYGGKCGIQVPARRSRKRENLQSFHRLKSRGMTPRLDTS